MKTPMKVVYIAGPFRASSGWEIEQNIRRAECLALEVWRAGFAVICPHTNTRFYSGAAPDEIWLEGDLELLRRCDAVLLLPKWRESSGTCAEVTEAMKCGIHVFDLLPDLVKHFQWPKATDNQTTKLEKTK